MNKSQLIEAVAVKAGITKVDAKKAVDAVVGAIAATLKKSDKVSLIGFGTFSVIKRVKRKGRNPQTGQELNIPAKKVVKFKPGSELSKLVAK
ncbi:MAG: HU family DNA-binding protein [Prevotellaceae bacterium]|jgi:DNA-binding protein HU-beta|nr:HU family DNA-binding protein [Prevotellaceae bacterium]